MIHKLNPQYVRGLIDAEGCFYAAPNIRSTNKVGFRLYNKNLNILQSLKNFFGEGYIYENTHGSYNDVHEFVLSSKKQLRILLDFFEKHGEPIIKQSNRPRNKNSKTTYNMWKKEATEYVNRPTIKYSKKLKDKATKLREQGYTYQMIADDLGPSITTIYNWLNK